MTRTDRSERRSAPEERSRQRGRRSGRVRSIGRAARLGRYLDLFLDLWPAVRAGDDVARAQSPRPRRAVAAQDPREPARQYRGAVPARLHRIAEPALRPGADHDPTVAPDRSRRCPGGRTGTRDGDRSDRRGGPGRGPPAGRGGRLRSRDSCLSARLSRRPAALRPGGRILRDAGRDGHRLGRGANPPQGAGRAQLCDLPHQVRLCPRADLQRADPARRHRIAG